MASKCNYLGCTGNECTGEVEGPVGSKHCVECGKLWYVFKGMFCDKCGDFYCPPYWQNEFKFGFSDDGGRGGRCPKCCSIDSEAFVAICVNFYKPLPS